jgi:hypothetical protein
MAVWHVVKHTTLYALQHFIIEMHYHIMFEFCLILHWMLQKIMSSSTKGVSISHALLMQNFHLCDYL